MFGNLMDLECAPLLLVRRGGRIPRDFELCSVKPSSYRVVGDRFDDTIHFHSFLNQIGEVAFL